MREILFKAKRIDDGEWVEGWLFKTQEHSYIAYDRQFDDDLFLSPQNIFIEVDTNTICQYTGLTDKNGNKIWKNDVIKDSDGDIGIIKYGVDGRASFVVCYEKKNEYILLGENNIEMLKIEVIGNIFDNPELLERN